MMALKHQASSNRKWRSARRLVEGHFPSGLPSVLFLTDPDRTPNPVSIARRLPPGTGIIYRHFGAADREATAQELAYLAHSHHLLLLIAADPQLARKVGAQGVHWPEAKLREARRWRDRFPIQTASAHSASAMRRAAKAGMDAALVSAVFPSASPSASPPIGPARLARLAANAHLPLFGLGGLNASNAARIAEFAGIAAIEGLIE